MISVDLTPMGIREVASIVSSYYQSGTEVLSFFPNTAFSITPSNVFLLVTTTGTPDLTQPITAFIQYY